MSRRYHVLVISARQHGSLPWSPLVYQSLNRTARNAKIVYINYKIKFFVWQTWLSKLFQGDVMPNCSRMLRSEKVA